MRSGLISSPRLGGGSDSMLRRALRVPSVECVPARSLLAQLVARSDARNGARGGSDSPPAAPTAARGSTPSAYMLPRSVKVRPAAERNGGQTQPSMRPPASLAHADERGGAAGELVDAEGGRAPAEAAVAAVGAAGGAQGGRPAERPPSLSERPPVLSDRPPAAQPLARTASIMRAESLCTTEASHGTGVTTLSATATQLHAAAAGTRAHQGLGVSATAAVGARAPAAASHQPSEMQPRTAVPQLARKPLGVPLVSPPGMPTGTRLDGALVQHGSAGHHTVIVVPPRAGVTGAPTTIRRPLEPSLQQRTAGGAAAGQGGAITVYAECAQLTISDLAGVRRARLSCVGLLLPASCPPAALAASPSATRSFADRPAVVAVQYAPRLTRRPARPLSNLPPGAPLSCALARRPVQATDGLPRRAAPQAHVAAPSRSGAARRGCRPVCRRRATREHKAPARACQRGSGGASSLGGRQGGRERHGSAG